MTPRPGPRIPPLPEACWDDAVRAALDRGSSSLRVAKTPNVVGTLLHHPDLAGRFLAYNGLFVTDSTIDVRLRELLILTVARAARSPYEWLQHVRTAERYGVGPEDIGAIAAGARLDSWSPAEVAAVDAAAQLLDGYSVDDATWSRLMTHFDYRQVVEIVFAVGTYACLAMSVNAFRVQLDPELENIDRSAVAGWGGDQ